MSDPHGGPPHEHERGPGGPGGPGEPHGPPPHRGGPPAGPGRCGPHDRIGHSEQAWERAFEQALHEIRVELIKAEIKTLWGAQLQATAKGAAEALHADWKKFWSEHKEDLEPEVGEPGQRIRDLIREQIKKNIG